jgi:glucokinase
MEAGITFSPAKAATPISAPQGDLQIELLRFLKGRFGHVSYERILSGPGLVNVYEFLRETGCGKESAEFAVLLKNSDPAAAISRAALDGTHPLAEKALDLWISVYGAEAANLALKVMATGGMFLAGGISPKVLAKLTGPLFMQAFLAKGRLRSLVEANSGTGRHQREGRSAGGSALRLRSGQELVKA